MDEANKLSTKTHRSGWRGVQWDAVRLDETRRSRCEDGVRGDRRDIYDDGGNDIGRDGKLWRDAVTFRIRRRPRKRDYNNTIA